MMPDRAGLPALNPPPSLGALFLVFAKLGSISFGGGLSGWMMHECVRRKRWMHEDEFLTGLAMAQALPGVNVVNLPIWIGYRLGGSLGALVSALGVIIPPMGVVIGMASIYGELQRYPQTNLALQGAATAAIGLSLSMGLQAARRQIRALWPACMMAAVFIGIGVLGWPMILVVGLIAPISIGLAYGLRPKN